MDGDEKRGSEHWGDYTGAEERLVVSGWWIVPEGKGSEIGTGTGTGTSIPTLPPHSCGEKFPARDTAYTAEWEGAGIRSPTSCHQSLCPGRNLHPHPSSLFAARSFRLAIRPTPRIRGREPESPFTITFPHRPPTTDHRPPTTDHRPPTTDHRPPTTDHRPLFPSGTIHHPPSTNHFPAN